MKVTSGEDGQLVYELHQSDINTYLTCPERARALWSGEVVDHPTEASARGTAVHTAIEASLKGLNRSEAYNEAVYVFDQLMAKPGFRWVKTVRYDTVMRHIATCFDAWLGKVYPTLGNPVGIEVPFNLLFDYRPLGDVCDTTYGQHTAYDDVVVNLAGIIDYIDETGIEDWKTGDNLAKYTPGFGGEGWKLQRWGIQPSVYTWAANQLGLVEPLDGAVSFTYTAMQITTGDVIRLPCSRSETDWERLRTICWNIVKMHLADLDTWPINNQHALCSEKWCPNHAWCMGAACNPTSDTENHENPAYGVLTSPGLI